MPEELRLPVTRAGSRVEGSRAAPRTPGGGSSFGPISPAGGAQGRQQGYLTRSGDHQIGWRPDRSYRRLASGTFPSSRSRRREPDREQHFRAGVWSPVPCFLPSEGHRTSSPRNLDRPSPGTGLSSRHIGPFPRAIRPRRERGVLQSGKARRSVGHLSGRPSQCQATPRSSTALRSPPRTRFDGSRAPSASPEVVP